MKFFLLINLIVCLNLFASNSSFITEKDFHKKRVVVAGIFTKKRTYFDSGMYQVEQPKQEKPEQPERLSEKTSKEEAIV